MKGSIPSITKYSANAASKSFQSIAPDSGDLIRCRLFPAVRLVQVTQKIAI